MNGPVFSYAAIAGAVRAAPDRATQPNRTEAVALYSLSESMPTSADDTELPADASLPLTAHAAFVEVRSKNDVAAVVINADGEILEATEVAAAMLGYETSALVGRSLQDLGADGWRWSISNALMRLSSASPKPFNLQLLGRSGRRSLIEMIPRPNLREHGVDRQHLLVWREQQIHNRKGPVSAGETELRRLAFALLDTQDDQRSRIASDLHDGVGPLVIAAKFFAEGAIGRLNAGDTKQAAGMLETTAARLRDVLSELHRITVELRPNSLNDLGLLPTITWYCRDFGLLRPQLKLACELRVAEERIPPELKLQIFRIIEEAMRNVGTHSGACEASVSLAEEGHELALRIEDNGCGFDTAWVLESDPGGMGIGLHSIAKRVDGTGGRLEIRSQRGRGTVLVARWPLP